MCLVAYGGGVLILSALIQRHLEAGGPAFQLLHCRGAEGISRGQQHLVATFLQQVGELGTRGGLAGSVHPHHHDNHRPAFLRLRQLGQISRESRPELSFDVVSYVAGILAVLLLQLLNKGYNTLGADIGRYEVRLQLIPVNLGFAKELVYQTREEMSHMQRSGMIICWQRRL